MAAVLAAPAAAAGLNGGGVGLMPCAQALPLFDQPDYRRAFLSWTLGYMTGVNGAMIAKERHFRDMAGLNVDLIVGTLKAACTRQPDGILLRGAEEFWLSLPSREWTPVP